MLIKSNTSGQTLRLGEIAKVELGGLQYNVNLLNDGQPARESIIISRLGLRSITLKNFNMNEKKEVTFMICSTTQ